MFFYSRTSNVDMTALFWTAVGLMVIARCLRDGLDVRRAATLGVTAALATATKDASVFAFAFMAPALLFRLGPNPKAAWRAIGAGIGAGAVTYAVGSGLVFDPDRLRLHVEYILRSISSPVRVRRGAAESIGSVRT